MPSSLNVAKYFLSLTDRDAGDLISNLKLQKLLYYAQGFHLAIYDTALFSEKLEAWTHGPVVPNVYHTYKGYNNGPIPPPKDFDPAVFSSKTRKFLDEVYRVYGQFSAWKLANMTHEEPPWNKYKDTASPISHSVMRAHFRTLVK